MRPLTRLLFFISLMIIVIGVGCANNILAMEFGTRVLKHKDEGPDVAILQFCLQKAGYYVERIDGIFGKHTLKSLIQFQKEHQLKPDGIVGSQTYRFLPQLEVVPSRGQFTQEDLTYLARVIHAEARGETFRGQVAVGAVVLNRVESELFPDSIRRVILQEGQFCTLADGQVQLLPSQTSIEAAKAAILGYDPTFGALFFYNPKTAAKRNWVATRPFSTRIGAHIFTH